MNARLLARALARGPAGVVLAALLALAAAALAQPADAGRAQQLQAELQKRFAAADTNGDGRLTKDEAQAGMPFVYKHFAAIDRAHSGAVTLADIAAYARAQRASRQGATP